METTKDNEDKTANDKFFNNEAKVWIDKLGSPPFDYSGSYPLLEEDDYFKQTLLNAISIIIPVGEKFFISNIADYYKNLNLNEYEKEEARIFMYQESAHFKQHLKYNQNLCDERGYDLDKLVFPVKFNLDEVHKKDSVKYRLALTAASEHLTCIIAEMILHFPQWLETISDSFRSLLRWHSVEELDHRSYAFDLYMRHYPDLEYLHDTMRDFGPRMLRFYEGISCSMAANDGRGAKAMRQWMYNSDFMTQPGSPLEYFITAFNCFYKEGFHPESYVNFEIIKTDFSID